MAITMIEKVCQTCGQTFSRRAGAFAKPNAGRYCSHSCAAVAGGRARPHVVPESTKAERIRANGLINTRVSRGLMDKPIACESCGKEGPVDGHHDDYNRPDVVRWLCRSCHMSLH